MSCSLGMLGQLPPTVQWTVISVAFDKAIPTPSFGSSGITRNADTIDMVAATDILAELVER